MLVGGERQLAFFPNYSGEKVVIKGRLTKLIEQLQHMQEQQRPTVVLASGDPLFYGIGGYLAKKLNVTVYPYVSSLQIAFSRLGESWQDAYVTSVHGRSIKGLAQRIDRRPKVALLTDETNNPNAIANYMLDFGMTEYEAFVAENLGGANERCGKYTLEQMMVQTFSTLNIVILRRKVKDEHRKETQASSGDTLGIPDEAFAQRKPDKGLITKKEIRVLSIAALNIHEKSVVWDIGTCTGSIAIEAAKLAREGAVYAIEKNEADLEHCRLNMRTFRADISLYHGKAPQFMDEWPAPDAVFIGGTGGELERIIALSCKRLNRDGRIVLNAATIETLHEAQHAFAKQGFSTSITHAQISRSKPILQMTRFEALNPIYIITATRKSDMD